jgi:hypothetical protein
MGFLSEIAAAFNLWDRLINKTRLVVKVKPIQVIDKNSYVECGDGTRVILPKRVDIEITVINKGPGSIYIEEVKFVLRSPLSDRLDNSFSYPPSFFGFSDPLEIKERRKAVFQIDREKLKEEALKNDLGEAIEQIWVKDSADNFTKFRIPWGMKHTLDFRG